MPAPPRTYPIILAHGIARFDFLREAFLKNTRLLFGDAFDKMLFHLAEHGIKVPTDRLHYFRGVLTLLEQGNEFDVHHTSVSFARSLPERASDLKTQIENILASTGAEKVHIIAHSMGGLDSRYMIARLGMHARVASLTTVGTPHLGTSLADRNLDAWGEDFIRLLKQAIDLSGFRDLSRPACAAFNESVRNAEASNQVFYQTYAASEEYPLVFNPLKPAWKIIDQHEGANDGLVSLTSQAWQPEARGDDGSLKRIEQKPFPVPADHLNEVGWWDLSELQGTGPYAGIGGRERYERAVKQVYLDIARDLKSRFPS